MELQKLQTLVVVPNQGLVVQLYEDFKEYGWNVESLEVMPDHIHLFIQIGPEDRPVDIAQVLKSISAVYIFTKFPELKGRKFWGSGLWSTGVYYGSVGNVNEQTIKEYINGQKQD